MSASVNAQSGTVDDLVPALVEEAGFAAVERAVLPAQEARLVPPPGSLHEEVLRELRQTFPEGLYAHQSKALSQFLGGEDVCLATATASGKSLVFLAAAAHLLCSARETKVLALYPAKALIQDQLGKWRRFLEPFSIAVGYIDGAVPMVQRNELLTRSRVVLMTPDVAHAWLMSHLQEAEVRQFLNAAGLLVLDEAHVYDGVFGTNMAYFLRRLLAASAIRHIIAATATIGSPVEFLERLTGRTMVLVAGADDGAPRPKKSITLLRHIRGNSFDSTVALLRELSAGRLGRFLAFADSRRQVEQLVAAIDRDLAAQDPSDDSDEPEQVHDIPRRVLPYRSGYEEEDRRTIQDALTHGSLAGVVSTSALELGLDIGEIDLVVLLDSPPSVKAFWQRVGRAGRRDSGICLLIDSRGTIAADARGLKGYLARPVEPSWLYLDNQYVQYSQALCAAHEITGLGDRGYRKAALTSLPQTFFAMLDNELDPKEPVPQDLYPLKQRAQAGPHYEFPVRTGIETTFDVREHLLVGDRPLGTLTHSQLLREGYPGAIYYYLAQPYRVTQVSFHAGEVTVRRSKRWTTKPLLQNMVFPKLQGPLHGRSSDAGFLLEADLQVSERVTGFVEQRGPNKTTHNYTVGSSYSQRPLTRYLDTSGFCWYCTDNGVLTEEVADAILDAFCAVCGVEKRDVSVGLFHIEKSVLWPRAVKGCCIYDAVHGSLRLTRQLAERLDEILQVALAMAQGHETGAMSVESGVRAFTKFLSATSPFSIAESSLTASNPANHDGDWVTVVAPHQVAFLIEENVTREVTVRGNRFTPQGLMYQLASEQPGHIWMVPHNRVLPIAGNTVLLDMNLLTGEMRPPSTETVSS